MVSKAPFGAVVVGKQNALYPGPDKERLRNEN